jgi:hypothetical protein
MVGIGNHEYCYKTESHNDRSGANLPASAFPVNSEGPWGYGNGFHPSWGNYNTDSGGEVRLFVLRYRDLMYRDSVASQPFSATECPLQAMRSTGIRSSTDQCTC